MSDDIICSDCGGVGSDSNATFYCCRCRGTGWVHMIDEIHALEKVIKCKDYALEKLRNSKMKPPTDPTCPWVKEIRALEEKISRLEDANNILNSANVYDWQRIDKLRAENAALKAKIKEMENGKT